MAERALWITSLCTAFVLLALRWRRPAQERNLVPRYLAQVPVDARFHHPLRYERRGEGAVVYGLWSGRMDEALKDAVPAEHVGERWRDILERDRALVFLLGGMWREHNFPTGADAEPAEKGETKD